MSSKASVFLLTSFILLCFGLVFFPYHICFYFVSSAYTDTLVIMFGMFALLFNYLDYVRMLKRLLFVFIVKDMLLFSFSFFYFLTFSVIF